MTRSIIEKHIYIYFKVRLIFIFNPDIYIFLYIDEFKQNKVLDSLYFSLFQRFVWINDNPFTEKDAFHFNAIKCRNKFHVNNEKNLNVYKVFKIKF